MLFGRSVFHSVVERLREEANDTAENAPSGHHVSGLNVSFAVTTAESEEQRLHRSQAAYCEMLLHKESGADEADEKLKAMEAYLKVLDPQAIAAELALSNTSPLAELTEKRRAFARRNHPDCVPAAFRQNANIRMTIANQIIDSALEKCPR